MLLQEDHSIYFSTTEETSHLRMIMESLLILLARHDISYSGTVSPMVGAQFIFSSFCVCMAPLMTGFKKYAFMGSNVAQNEDLASLARAPLERAP
jgi:hypothetical protein